MSITPAYVPVPVEDFARFTSLAAELGQAAQTLAGAITTAAPTIRITAAEPAAVADTLPGVDNTGKASAGDQTTRRYTAAETAAFREQLHANIHATGVNGASAADLTAGAATLNRVQYTLRALETEGRVFRIGIGALRWYSMDNRTKVLDTMRRRVPNHDLTTEEAAEVLGIPVSRVREKVANGELGGRRVGKAYIVHRQAVIDHIRALGATIPQPATDTPQAG